MGIEPSAISDQYILPVVLAYTSLSILHQILVGLIIYLIVSSFQIASPIVGIEGRIEFNVSCLIFPLLSELQKRAGWINWVALHSFISQCVAVAPKSPVPSCCRCKSRLLGVAEH